MIDLRKAVYYEYIDDVVVEIFDKYKWGLRRLGINFSQELLETIVYCPNNLEGTLMAFSSWVLWLKSKGETSDPHILSETLINALRSESGWIPSDSQKYFLQQHSEILESPKISIWKAAAKYLGEELRNRVMVDISEYGDIIYMNNIILHQDEIEKIEAFKIYISELYL
jgi:hypothetical protein